MILMTGLLCTLLLFGAAPKTAQMRACAVETFPLVTTAEPPDPDAGFGDLPEPPSAADAKEDVEAILQEANREKEEIREKTDVSGTRRGLVFAGVIVIGICAVGFFFFKYKQP